MTFGEVIVAARAQANLSQRELAARIKNRDGKPISSQYLNDVERSRRNPPRPHLIEQLAAELRIPPAVLYFHAGRLPPEAAVIAASEQTIVKAYTVLLTILRDGHEPGDRDGQERANVQ
jgi:transcriptional regulator with XRE-family HTH domain